MYIKRLVVRNGKYNLLSSAGNGASTGSCTKSVADSDTYANGPGVRNHDRPSWKLKLNYHFVEKLKSETDDTYCV